jgi:cytochrome c551/c552
MKKWIARATMILVVAMVAIQFVPIQRTNPPVESDVQTSGELKAIFRRACYDCHSNETVWPWYSHIAPISFLIANDVKEGRRELNFSTWDQYNEQRKARKLKEIVEQIEQNKMPQWYYILMHREAKLSESDKEIILKWAKKPS